jgi:toxin ParE1/3/4
MTFAFHPDAKTEFFGAINYYENVETGLGFDFSVEIFSTIQNIVDYPNAWPVLEAEVRRCLVNRFPYGVLYSIEADEIYILAVMHLHRDPDYWKDRR